VNEDELRRYAIAFLVAQLMSKSSNTNRESTYNLLKSVTLMAAKNALRKLSTILDIMFRTLPPSNAAMALPV